MQKRLQSDIDALRPGSLFDSSTIKDFFVELERYEQILAVDMMDFKENTIEPIWALREDMQFWLGENRDRLVLGKQESASESGAHMIHVPIGFWCMVHVSF